MTDCKVSEANTLFKPNNEDLRIAEKTNFIFKKKMRSFAIILQKTR
jgi:hypothetical protein